MKQVFDQQQLQFEIIAPHQGPLTSGASAAQSYITTSSVFYDRLTCKVSFKKPIAREANWHSGKFDFAVQYLAASDEHWALQQDSRGNIGE